MTAALPVRSVDDLRGRRTVVLGLARSGVAASRFLADAGAVVAAYDRRPAGDLADAIAALGSRPVRLALGVADADAAALLEHADLLVTSPSVSARFPTTDPWLREALVAAEARGAEVVSEVGLFLRLTRSRVLPPNLPARAIRAPRFFQSVSLEFKVDDVDAGSNSG